MESSSPIIAYIPARGGSKRILNKNRKLLKGKPIILYVIEVLQKLSWIHTICVSTDDAEIKEIAEKAGALTLGFRDKELANDYCPFLELLKKDIGRFENHLKFNGRNYKVLMALPTAALLTEKDLEKGKEKFLKGKVDFLFSAKEYEISPFWAFQEKDKKLSAMFPECLNERSQDLPKTFSDAGLFYFLDSKFIREAKESWFLASNIDYFLIDPAIAIDVDTPTDWKKLEERLNPNR